MSLNFVSVFGKREETQKGFFLHVQSGSESFS